MTCRFCHESEVYKPRWSGGRCKSCFKLEKAAQFQRTKAKRPERVLWSAAKQRAKLSGVPFSIRVTDVVIPEFCPILGVRLEAGHGRRSPSAPSLDRIVPALGYVPGNVMVVSERANRIKNDASPETLRKLADYVWHAA